MSVAAPSRRRRQFKLGFPWFRAAAAIAIVAAITIPSWYAAHRFDSAIWKAGENAEDSPRLRMVDDLLRRGVLIGMGRNEVDDLLGSPTDTKYFRDYYDYVYYLGPERGLISIDSEWLGIKFKDNIVVEAALLRD